MTRTLLQQALDALENVTQFAEAQICMHEETYRGGVLWEICSQCGAKWADDEGGKPKFKWPKETNAARKTITAIRSALAAPQPEPVPEPFLCIAPACGNDCSDCNKAISAQTMRDYAIGYAMLRNAPIEAIRAGGVFAGRTPDNVVINGADLDAATFGAAAQQSIDQQVESINAVFDAWRNGEDASMTLALATPPAAPIDGFGGNLDEAFERAPAVPAGRLRLECKPCGDAWLHMDAPSGNKASINLGQYGAALAVTTIVGRVVQEIAASSAAPVVREPQYWCPETGELCGKCAKTGTCEASILQAHGIGGGGNG